MTSDVKFYAAILMRRMPLILALAVVCTAGAVAFALSLPHSFTSSTRLLVEAPQTAETLSTSTVETTPMSMMGLIQQKIMARDSLVALARRHDMVPEGTTLTESEIANLVSSSISMRSSSTTQGEDNVVTTVTVNSGEAVKAAAIAQDVVDQILAENTRQRTSVASGTLSIIQSEVDALRTELEARNAEIIKFQQDNAEALPTGLQYRQTRQIALQTELVENQREIEDLDLQAKNLRDVYAANGGGTGLEQQLAQIQTELTQARIIYSESSPNVRRLLARQTQIEEQLRARADAPAQEEQLATTGNATLDFQLADIEKRKQALLDQAPRIEAELERLSALIDATPANQSALLGLERDQEAAQTRYDTARVRLLRAESGDRLEQSEQAQRITVLEAPAVPAWPSKPNRKLIAVAGLVGGLGLGFGLTVLLELLSSRLRRPADLVRTLNITPLVTIPVLPKTRG